MTSRLLATFAVLVALIATPASAGTCGGILNPVLVTTTGIGFGLYSPGSASDTHANGTINVTCTVTLGNGLPNFTIALGGSATNQFNPRVMTFLTSTLNYNLFTTSSYSTIWGDGTAPTQTQSYSSGAGSTAFTVYGQIPNHQFVPLGLYSDSVQVVVTF